jgi:hypothetical protein
MTNSNDAINELRAAFEQAYPLRFFKPPRFENGQYSAEGGGDYQKHFELFQKGVALGAQRALAAASQWQPMSIDPTISGWYLVGHKGKDYWEKAHYSPTLGWNREFDFGSTHWLFVSPIANAADSAAPERADAYYVQYTGDHVGNDVLWWREGGCGYTTDLREAGVYTKDDALKLQALRGTERAWQKAYIDTISRPTVDFQHLDGAHSLAKSVVAGLPGVSL